MATLSRTRKAQAERRAPELEESEFVCSRQLAQQLLTGLIQGSEAGDGDANPLYLFAAEKRGVRITVLPGTKS
jgi:hypothetical protein